MPSLGGWEFVILIGILVLLFSAKKLPDMARSIGQSARIFKGEMKGMKDDEEAPKRRRRRAPAASGPRRRPRRRALPVVPPPRRTPDRAVAARLAPTPRAGPGRCARFSRAEVLAPPGGRAARRIPTAR